MTTRILSHKEKRVKIVLMYVKLKKIGFVIILELCADPRRFNDNPIPNERASFKMKFHSRFSHKWLQTQCYTRCAVRAGRTIAYILTKCKDFLPGRDLISATCTSGTKDCIL